LVIYSDKESCEPIEKYAKSNPRIILIIKPNEQFKNYIYQENWIRNHNKNDLLNTRIDWKVNMLWAEKIHFVHETMTRKYFDTEYYGWCDIGYFRCGDRDLSKEELKNWSNPEKIRSLQKDKIYYALVNNNKEYVKYLCNIIQHKNTFDIPNTPIPNYQVSVAGGFFISHKNNIEWWKYTFDKKLEAYFLHNYLVKDDQIIIADCVFSNPDRFYLCQEGDHRYDNWFLFQRLFV
jgi:hypothetical protein